MTTIGWWECTDDITEFNREHEPGGLRVVLNFGPGFQRIDMQRREPYSSTGVFVAGLEPKWITLQAKALEFFVTQGHKDSNGSWVTDKLYIFIVGDPPPFLEWRPCNEPEVYQKRVPGSSSMIIEKV